MTEPANIGRVPLTEQTWRRLHSVAVFGAGAMRVAPGVRDLVLAMCIDGVGAFLSHLDSGAMCIAPKLLADGKLVIDFGVYLESGLPNEPYFWTRALIDDRLDVTEEEVAWIYRMAERTGQAAGVDVPDEIDPDPEA
jgi:hypothetical protein